ncbi:unnamed protein product [Periconia digitata]|uniref:Serine-threonine protein kinase 19-domain-containing protein n=1 Tax=Periconia digitata TaxID=1303443 RepID=A0A9W4UT64_9PLEO|nr:unnamed protein product [Periconia digitata]
MSFQITPARSSRVTKPKRTSAAAAMGLRRSVSSPSSTATLRRKSSQSSNSTMTSSSTWEDDDEKLDDMGLVASIAADLNLRDVPQYIEYIQNNMFDQLPTTGAGMSSTRIPEVLNFRRVLPPIVTVAHIDALASSATATEREIAELSRAGILRRVIIPRRGLGAAAIGDGIVSVREWQKRVEAHPDISSDLKEQYISTLLTNPTKQSIPNTAFSPSSLKILTSTGFLTTATSPSHLDTRTTSFATTQSSNPLSSLSTSASRHAAGSLGAVGGRAASTHIPGGVVVSPSPSSHHGNMPVTSYYNFSLPNTGAHVKLVTEARAHFLSLLAKRKFKEAPLHVLKELWDGGVPASKAQLEIAEKKRARKEFKGVLAGRTKKWKVFFGLRFEWVLAECVGAGLVEVFETGVGKGVRVAG